MTERVRNELGREKMELIVHGASFGRMVAMNLPRIRPDLTDPLSPIQIRLICTLVAPTGYENICSPTFVAEHYQNDPYQAEYLEAISLVREGRIPENDNNRGYLQNVVIKIAGTMTEENNKFPTRFMLKALDYFPQATLGILRAIRTMVPSSRETIDSYLSFFTGCNVRLMNKFFQTESNGFQLEKLIASDKVKSAYLQIPILGISAEEDCYAALEGNSARLISILPNNYCHITQPGRHHDFKELDAKMVYCFFTGDIEELQKIARETPGFTLRSLPPGFEGQLEQYRQQVVEHVTQSPSSSTALMSQTLNASMVEIQSVSTSRSAIPLEIEKKEDITSPLVLAPQPESVAARLAMG